MECHQRGSRGEVGASQTKEEPRTFYCFVTPDRADITHDRVHILVKALMFIVLSFVLAPGLRSSQSVSKILGWRLVQTICTPPVNTNTSLAEPDCQTPDFFDEQNIDVLYIIISRIISLSLRPCLIFII